MFVQSVDQFHILMMFIMIMTGFLDFDFIGTKKAVHFENLAKNVEKLAMILLVHTSH